MVYALKHIKKWGGNCKVLSTGEVLSELGITKQTLYKWIMLGKVKAISHEIGKRIFLEFDPNEIGRVKKLLKKDREAGKPILKKG